MTADVYGRLMDGIVQIPRRSRIVHAYTTKSLAELPQRAPRQHGSGHAVLWTIASIKLVISR